MGFIREGRTQATMFPVTLDEFIPADHVGDAVCGAPSSNIHSPR